MKYRVMANDGTLEDFETEAEARVLYDKKKKTPLLTRITGGEKITGNIHICRHDEGKPCEIIERF